MQPERRTNGAQLVDELLRKVKEGVNPWVRSSNTLATY
jgi:hypothetical protein